MNMFRVGWSPVLIAILAIVGYYYEWPIEMLALVLFIIMVIGLAIVATSGRERELERASQRLKELAGYFNRRFAGNSSLSIFAIIYYLLKVDNPKIWEWARSCDMAQRVFNTWCDSFISRVESDIRMRRYTVYLRTYLNELWQLTSHYYEYVEQFYEVAGQVEVPRETREQYHKFAMEYNAFVSNFQDTISELKKVARTEIEPPSVKLAQELPEKPVAPAPKEPERKAPPSSRMGFITG
jgi:ABC-type multidrug transport system fused ATPase/permease subunit